MDEKETNGSVGWTKKRQSWKSGDETPVETAILNVLNPVPNERHIVLREIEALANSRKTETLKLKGLTLSQN